MSKDYELERLNRIYELGQFQKVQQLVEDRDRQIEQAQKNRYASHYQLELSPKPKGEIKNQQITRKEIKTQDQVYKEITDINTDYHDKLKSTYEDLSRQDNHDFIRDTVEQLDGRDLDYIIDKGPDAFLDKKRQDQIKSEFKGQVKEGLPTYLDEKTYQDIWDENSQNIAKENEDLDLKPTSIQIGAEEMDKLMADDQFDLDDKKQDKGNSKDHDQKRDKPKPDPADEYE